MTRRQPIIDAEFEVITPADRTPTSQEAWGAGANGRIPPYPSMKARLRHYAWTAWQVVWIMAAALTCYYGAIWIKAVLRGIFES